MASDHRPRVAHALMLRTPGWLWPRLPGAWRTWAVDAHLRWVQAGAPGGRRG